MGRATRSMMMRASTKMASPNSTLQEWKLLQVAVTLSWPMAAISSAFCRANSYNSFLFFFHSRFNKFLLVSGNLALIGRPGGAAS